MPERPPTIPDELLPAATDELSPDDDLTLASAAIPDLVAPQPREPRPFGMGWRWDERHDRFERSGGAPAVTRGEETLQTLVRNVIQIAQLAHPVFPDDFGMADPAGIIGSGEVTVSGMARMQRDIDEALRAAEPRITSTQNYRFTPDPPIMYLDFEITLDDGERVPINGAALV